MLKSKVEDESPRAGITAFEKEAVRLTKCPGKSRHRTLDHLKGSRLAAIVEIDRKAIAGNAEIGSPQPARNVWNLSGLVATKFGATSTYEEIPQSKKFIVT